MDTFIKTIFTALRTLIMPSFCVHCNEWLSEPLIFCSVCKKLITPLVSTDLTITSLTSISVCALGAYEEPLKSLILAKSTLQQRLASKQLGRLLWDMTLLNTMNFDYIIPIPLHWTRYAYRGYNQAEVMAQVIAQKSNRPCINILKRIKRTPFQSSVIGEQRSLNVYDAFDLALSLENQSLYYNKNLLIIDDLMTTGATLKAAAKKLLLLKPATLKAAVACRVI